MTNVYELQPRFAALFSGLDIAFGTGKGEWVKRPLRREDWIEHLQGVGPGIGVAPLREDSTVKFAAIDLDEPNFDLAREMQQYIPGTSFIERSRSGNAHVWVFFSKPCPAWVAMGVLKEATYVVGRKDVEVFPKNPDFGRVRLGNYINLPFHGAERPIMHYDGDGWYPHDHMHTPGFSDLTLTMFLDEAESTLNDPLDWERRAALMQIVPPSERKTSAQFGTQRNLHICAEHILSGEAGPISHGHQNATLFMLAKCLTNWEQVDHDEALDMLISTADDLFDPVPSRREIGRILSNVERARYTSTGCDDPLVQPFAHPSCKIANP